MPAPIMAGIMALLAALGGWLLSKGIKSLIMVIFGFLMYKYDFGWTIVQAWLGSTRINGLIDWLAMPEIPGDWDEILSAVNAWMPLAECWRIVKAYYSLKVAAISLTWMLRLMK